MRYLELFEALLFELRRDIRHILEREHQRRGLHAVCVPLPEFYRLGAVLFIRPAVEEFQLSLVPGVRLRAVQLLQTGE